MGNYVSCTLSTPVGVLGQSKQLRRTAKVILPGGEIRSVEAPIKAAEIMLETPSFFLVNSRGLQIGRRISALSADEDLEMANVYVTFPMKRLNSVVTATDLAAAFMAAEAVKKRRRRGKSAANPSSSCAGNRKFKRILPENEEWRENGEEPTEKAAPKLNLDDIEDFSAPEFMHRLSMSRSKKPLLETIEEDQPICLR